MSRFFARATAHRSAHKKTEPTRQRPEPTRPSDSQNGLDRQKARRPRATHCRTSFDLVTAFPDAKDVTPGHADRPQPDVTAMLMPSSMTILPNVR